MARFFGVATATVKTWRQEKMPGSPPWDLSAIAQWKIQRITSAQAQKRNSKELLETFKARRERLKYWTERGDLVPRAEHEALVLTLIEAFKGGLERMTLALGAQTVGLTQEQSTRLHEESFSRLLDELSSNADFGADEEEGEDPPAVAP